MTDQSAAQPFSMHLPVYKGWWLIFVTLVVLFWARGEYVSMIRFFNLSPEYPPADAPYFVKWLIWTAAGFPLLEIWLWNLLGAEYVEITADCVLLRKQFGPFSRVRKFQKAQIAKLRVDTSRWGRLAQNCGRGAALALEAGGTEHWFGLHLDGNEAEHIEEQLRARVANLRREE